MGQLLSQPLTDKVIEHRSLHHFSYALGSMQGYRLSQEDAHAIHFEPQLQFRDVDTLVKTIDVKIFAVFDGHGGAETSGYLSTHLVPILLDQIKQDEITGYKTTQGLMIHKIKSAFLKADHNLYSHLKGTRSQSGSTAILGIIVENEQLYSINTGDSRLIVSCGGAPKDLSYDHKPTHIGELIRINDAGGSVSYDRVGGVLALSRAFGDFSFKLRTIGNDKLHSEETPVSVEPECIPHEIQMIDEFIVLACDGIWDVFTSRELIRFIRHQLCLGMDLSSVVSRVLERSLSLADHQTGAGFDNMSLIIVACQQPEETLEQWHNRLKLQIEAEKLR